MPPIPCAHCGTMFMRKDNLESSAKLCNNCLYKQMNKVKTNRGEMSMKILIECSKEQHAKIEELCINQGKNFSQYFLELHDLNMQPEFKFKENTECCLSKSKALSSIEEEEKTSKKSSAKKKI